jgi:hypothetical protein
MLEVKAVRDFFVALLVSFLSINLMTEVSASPQQFSAEGEYRIGDRDTREDAKKYALAEAKRKVVEQAGVYVESCTEVNNFQFSQDKINIIAQAIITIKNERTEFLENGVLCRAYVTAVIDTDSVENKLLSFIKKAEKDAAKKDRKDTADRNKPVDTVKSLVSDTVPKTSNQSDSQEPDAPRDLSNDFAELEETRLKMVNDLSRATAYTAGSEYKLQEVTGIKGVGFHDEKGEISNYLKENSEMTKNYRFAELTSFVELEGAEKIMQILEEINKKKILDAKDRMTWAKIERNRAKSYGEIALKEATDLFKRAEVLMIDANDNERERLMMLRREADDTIKLVHALEIRNKDVDAVAKKYEKANKITVKNDKHNPKKKNFFEELWDRIK